MNAHVKVLLEEAKKLSVHERIELTDLICGDVAFQPAQIQDVLARH